jgi:hypothetical protein
MEWLLHEGCQEPKYRPGNFFMLLIIGKKGKTFGQYKALNLLQ